MVADPKSSKIRCKSCFKMKSPKHLDSTKGKCYDCLEMKDREIQLFELRKNGYQSIPSSLIDSVSLKRMKSILIDYQISFVELKSGKDAEIFVTQDDFLKMVNQLISFYIEHPPIKLQKLQDENEKLKSKIETMKNQIKPKQQSKASIHKSIDQNVSSMNSTQNSPSISSLDQWINDQNKSLDQITGASTPYPQDPLDDI